MLADIINRTWSPSRGQAETIIRDGLSRRRIIFRGAAIGLGAFLVGCAGWNGDVATLTATVVQYVQNIGGALATSITALQQMPSPPAGLTSILGSLAGWVADAKSIAGSISTATLVSTATGSITNFIHDFNQIVLAVINNPAVSAAVSATGFGWALFAANVLLPLVEQGLGIVIALVTPPTPAPVVPPVAAHRMMTARVAAALTPETANELLIAIAAVSQGGR